MTRTECGITSVCALSPSHSATEMKESKRGLPAHCGNHGYCKDALLAGKTPYFALHKGIAIGLLKAIGFRNKPKRTIFAFWCGDPIEHDFANAAPGELLLKKEQWKNLSKNLETLRQLPNASSASGAP